jgi:hypothetical protein
MPYREVQVGADPTHARSVLLSDAMGTDADCFLFVGPDMVPSGRDLVTLSESPRLDEGNAVSGCYVGANGEVAVEAGDGSLGATVESRFVPMLVGECGFAAVHRAAVERMAAILPALRSDEASTIWYPFFMPAVLSQESNGQRDREYLSADGAFWWRLRLSGTTSWIDTEMWVGRVQRTVCMPQTRREEEQSRRPAARDETLEAAPGGTSRSA